MSRDRAGFVAGYEQTRPPHPLCCGPSPVLPLSSGCSRVGLYDLVSPMTFSFSELETGLELLLLPNRTNGFL